jgi:eukaryotic-like serine/threonine-protein kinase
VWRTVQCVSDSTPVVLPVVPGLTGLTVLARGGYATVYRATQLSVDRDVAVKVENRTLESDKDQRRFVREARAAGRMSSHPHVVDLFDVGVTDDGHPYMIMELCDGTYADRMKADPLSSREVRDVGAKIADALADAHALGVLHRDVKPANILITRFGEPALADFGLAVLAETRESSITLELTPAYAAPEMFHHGRPVPASDVYSLCATLYALVRGRPPRWRDGYDPTLASLVDMFAEPVPDLDGLPPDLTAVLRLGMANDPRHRPDAAQLRDELAGIYRDPDPTMIMRPVTLDEARSRWPVPGRTGAEDEPTQPGGGPYDTVTGPPRPRDGAGRDAISLDGPTQPRFGGPRQ